MGRILGARPGHCSEGGDSHSGACPGRGNVSGPLATILNFLQSQVAMGLFLSLPWEGLCLRLEGCDYAANTA